MNKHSDRPHLIWQSHQVVLIIYYFIDCKLGNKKSGNDSIQDLNTKYNFLAIGMKRFETPSYSGVYLENKTVMTPTPSPPPTAPK